MSATLQAEVFARYFASLEGRRFEAKGEDSSVAADQTCPRFVAKDTWTKALAKLFR